MNHNPRIADLSRSRTTKDFSLYLEHQPEAFFKSTIARHHALLVTFVLAPDSCSHCAMKKKEIKSWLKTVRPRHKRLTDTVESLISNLLDENKIDYLSVSGRTKKLDGALDKIRRKKYSDPKDQLTDLSGIRIITYFESQVRDIGEVIRRTFSVDEKNSLDQNQLLGEDRIGYRSIHFVCTLGADRESLPEYASFEGLKFEFQVRTVLQHAWAELAHDRSYKFSGELPKKLQRQLNLYSGMLEVVDQGFDEIARGVDKYKEKVETEGLSYIENIEIDSINIGEFIDQIKHENDVNISRMEIDKNFVNELKEFGVIKISDLKNLITKEFIDLHKEYQTTSDHTYVGFLRLVMMYNDIDKYFNKSWNKAWNAFDVRASQLLSRKYDKKKMEHIFDENKIILEDEDADVID